MVTTPASCVQCGRVIPAHKRRGTRACSAACRRPPSRAYRRAGLKLVPSSLRAEGVVEVAIVGSIGVVLTGQRLCLFSMEAWLSGAK